MLIVYLIIFFQIYPYLKTHHKTIKRIVTFNLSHMNLFLNNDILVQNLQIFLCFNYSLRLVPVLLL